MLKEVRSESTKYPSTGRPSGAPSLYGKRLRRIKLYLGLGAAAVIVLTVLALVLAVKVLFFIATPLLIAVVAGGAYIYLSNKFD